MTKLGDPSASVRCRIWPIKQKWSSINLRMVYYETRQASEPGRIIACALGGDWQMNREQKAGEVGDTVQMIEHFIQHRILEATTEAHPMELKWRTHSRSPLSCLPELADRIWICGMSDCSHCEVDDLGPLGEKMMKTHMQQPDVHAVRLVTLSEVNGMFIPAMHVCYAHTVDQNEAYADGLNDKVRRLMHGLRQERRLRTNQRQFLIYYGFAMVETAHAVLTCLQISEQGSMLLVSSRLSLSRDSSDRTVLAFKIANLWRRLLTFCFK
nr:hypothetical protein CFP56_02547 [Quercus suber]